MRTMSWHKRRKTFGGVASHIVRSLLGVVLFTGVTHSCVCLGSLAARIGEQLLEKVTLGLEEISELQEQLQEEEQKREVLTLSKIV